MTYKNYTNIEKSKKDNVLLALLQKLLDTNLNIGNII